MVRQPERGTNTPYIVDFIQICLAVKLLNSQEIRDLYENKGLSCPQIAKHFRVSRGTISRRLRELGFTDRHTLERASNPQNFRMSVPPYGYAIQDGKLVPNKTELKICRLVVESVERLKKTQCAVARELTKRGYKNRAGSTEWNSKTVFNIYNRWKGKI